MTGRRFRAAGEPAPPKPPKMPPRPPIGRPPNRKPNGAPRGIVPPALAAADPNPDAELIRVCAEHRAAFRAVNNSPVECDEDPMWPTYERAYDTIGQVGARTLDGLIAKARSAMTEATQPDGDVDRETGAVPEWAWSIVSDLLRLAEART